jgi:tetratricopeptide (TPR) repeat protein
MPRSFLSRVWKAVKPPPAPLPRRRLNRAQRRLIRGSSIAIALGAGTWGVFAYIASAPDRALGYFTQGNRLLGPGDFQGAAAEFTKAIEISPDFAEAYRARGDAWQAAGQDDAALADFEKAIAIDPTAWLAYISRGILWSTRGDSQRALADFNRSIELQPTAKAYYRRGVIYQELNDAKRAVDDYNRAIERDPRQPYFYLARAKVRRDLGDMAGAGKDQEVAEQVEKTQ